MHDRLAAYFSHPSGTAAFAALWRELMTHLAALDPRTAEGHASLAALRSALGPPALRPDVAHQQGMVDGVIGWIENQAANSTLDAIQEELANPVSRLVCATLIVAGPLHANAIARQTERDPAQMHRVLQRMTERGLLQRSAATTTTAAVRGRRVYDLTERARDAWARSTVRDGEW